MGIMSKLTVTPLLYAAGALAVLSAGLGLALWVQAGRHAGALDSAEAARDKAQTLADSRATRVRELTDANTSNATVNRDLADRLAACVGQDQATANINRQAVAERDAAVQARDAAVAAMRNQRNSSYATDADCKSWGDRPVCGAVSRSLREQWDQTRAAAGAAGSGGSGQAAAGHDR